MKHLWWLAVGLVTVAILGACGGQQLIPNDIQALMESEGGRWALKSIEGHGGIWRWRQRAYVKFDHSLLAIQRVVDTVISRRQRDTTITPRVDTLQNIRNHVVLDLQNGWRFAEGVAQSPSVRQGYNGDSVWLVEDDVPVLDTARLERIQAYLAELDFQFSFPFAFLDTTLKFELLADESTVDTTTAKGKEPGTYDTTLTPYTLKKLKVEFRPGQSSAEWYVCYLDQRDGKIRRMLSRPRTADGSGQIYLSIWSNLEGPLGLMLGGRRVSYPADESGTPTGPFIVDERFYGVELPRTLEIEPFTWTPPEPPAPDSTAADAG